jgi:hypothetical protein
VVFDKPGDVVVIADTFKNDVAATQRKKDTLFSRVWFKWWGECPREPTFSVVTNENRNGSLVASPYPIDPLPDSSIRRDIPKIFQMDGYLNRNADEIFQSIRATVNIRFHILRKQVLPRRSSDDDFQ